MQTITATVRLPGVFVSDFDGGSVGQGIDDGGYPGAALVIAAFKSSVTRRAGKGTVTTLTLTGTPTEVTDALDCIAEYAETFLEFDGGTPEDRASVRAATTVQARVAAARQGVTA